MSKFLYGLAIFLIALLAAGCGQAGDGEPGLPPEGLGGPDPLEEAFGADDGPAGEEEKNPGQDGAVAAVPFQGDRIPPHWPESIPLPENLYIWLAYQQEGSAGQQATIQFQVGGWPVDTFYFYRRLLEDQQWESVDWQRGGEDPYPYASVLDFEAVKGDDTLSVQLSEDGEGGHGQGITAGTIVFTKGKISPLDEYTWEFRDDDYFDKNTLPVSFDQKVWKDEKVTGYDHLPPGWPRQFHYTPEDMATYLEHDWSTEASSFVQRGGDDDGSRRLILQLNLFGHPADSYEVQQYRIGRSDYELVFQSPFPEHDDPLPTEEEPLQILATRQGEALHVTLWAGPEQGTTTTRLVFDERYDARFYPQGP